LFFSIFTTPTFSEAEIMKTVVNLRELLDVPVPFDLVIHDPMGKSEFNPMDRWAAWVVR